MCKYVLLSLLLLTNLTIQAQQTGMLFGLNAENKLCKIDPANGAITVLSTIRLTTGDAVEAPGAIDTDGERFFFIDTNNKMIVADLTDGSLINSFQLSSRSNGAVTYQCNKDRLYLYTTNFLVEMDPSNGQTRVVLDFSLPTNQFLVNSLTVDASNNRLYQLHVENNTRKLFSVEIDNNLDQTQNIPGNPAIDHLIYACHENRLLGMEGNRLKSLNPGDLSLTQIAEIQNLVSISAGTRSFNNREKLYYFIGVDNDDHQRLYTVNTLTGNFTASAPLSEPLTNLAYANACSATADFSIGNFCSDSPVDFINTSIADIFEWNFGDPVSGTQNTSNNPNPSHQFTGPGQYNVTLNARTCTDRDQFTRQIELVLPPDTLFSALIEKCKTDKITISAKNSEVDSYKWNTGATTDTLQVDDPGFYAVEVAIGECIKTYETEVSDIPCPCRPDMPNAFTPNNDQTNDSFRPAFVDDYCEVLVFNMKIFNRWGQLVYETDDSMQPWNGDFNGKPAPSDVYVWVIEFSYIDKDTGQQGELEMKKGDVALIR